MNILIIFITFYPLNFNVDVTIMVIMSDMATGYHGERGFVSFGGTCVNKVQHESMSIEDMI